MTQPKAYAQALRTALELAQGSHWQTTTCRNATRFSWDAIVPQYVNLIHATIERDFPIGATF